MSADRAFLRLLGLALAVTGLAIAGIRDTEDAGRDPPLLIDGHSAPVQYLNASAGDEGWVPAADTFSPASQLWPPDGFKSHNAALVLFVGRDGIAKVCGSPPAGIVRLGCQGNTKQGLPVIAIANPCLFPKSDFFAGIACHELAHLNGWKHQ